MGQAESDPLLEALIFQVYTRSLGPLIKAGCLLFAGRRV